MAKNIRTSWNPAPVDRFVIQLSTGSKKHPKCRIGPSTRAQLFRHRKAHSEFVVCCVQLQLVTFFVYVCVCVPVHIHIKHFGVSIYSVGVRCVFLLPFWSSIAVLREPTYYPQRNAETQKAGRVLLVSATLPNEHPKNEDGKWTIVTLQVSINSSPLPRVVDHWSIFIISTHCSTLCNRGWCCLLMIYNHDLNHCDDHHEYYHNI